MGRRVQFFRALALAAALAAAAGCKTVREELRPVRETTLTVARSGGEVSLSWIGIRGMYYSVMYTESRGARAKWIALPDAVNIPALVSGEPIIVHDRLGAGQPRYYRLVQDTKPLVP
jgi:hypothetical protein